MKIDWIEISNYRKFKNIKLHWDDDLTVLAGANNTGKTSLLTLLSYVFLGNRDYKIRDVSADWITGWWDKNRDNLIKSLQSGTYDDNFKNIFLCDLTVVKLKIDYDITKDEIINFADYIMDLDDDKYSFYFLVKIMLDSTRIVEHIKNNSSFLVKKNQNELLQSLLDILNNNIRIEANYADENFERLSIIQAISNFRSLFKFNFIEAARKIDDLETDKNNSISKIAIELAKKDDRWKATLEQLPYDLLNIFDKRKLQTTIEKLSMPMLQNAISQIEETNGSGKTSLRLSLDITEDNILEYLKSAIKAKYRINDFYLEENSQGLGYSNLIYLILKLEEIKKKIDNKKVNIIVIEEPESHMHPQMQSEFFKSLKSILSKERYIQGLITTHSDQMVRNAGFKNIKVLRNIKNNNVELCDLKEVSDKNKRLDKFFSWHFEIGYSNIIFADKVILYEGDTERMYIKRLLLPKISPEYKKLSNQYIAYIQVGGKHASKYRALVEFLRIPTLIITDIDYDFSKTKISDILKLKYGGKRGVNFSINELLDLQKDELVGNVYKREKQVGEYIYLTFQTNKDGYARTLEEAMLAKLLEINVESEILRSEWKKIKLSYKLEYSIPNNKQSDVNGKKIKEKDSKFTLRNILDSTSNGKTNFMYSVIMSGLEKKMEPNYINEGLEWLMKQ